MKVIAKIIGHFSGNMGYFPVVVNHETKKIGFRTSHKKYNAVPMDSKEGSLPKELLGDMIVYLNDGCWGHFEILTFDSEDKDETPIVSYCVSRESGNILPPAKFTESNYKYKAVRFEPEND